MVSGPELRVLGAALWTLALPVALAGCSIFGGQGTDDGGEGCPEIETELDDDQVSTAVGFAPADVLSWSLGERNVNAEWNPPPHGIGTSSTPGPVEVMVAIERADGDAVEVLPEGGVMFGEPAGCMPPRLRIPVAVSFASADGQVEERLSGALTAERSGFARVSADVDLDRLRGAFEWQSLSAGFELVQAVLDIAVIPTGSAGAFGAMVQIRTADAISAPAGGGPLLDWPADSGCAGAVPREPGEDEALYEAAIAHAAGRAWTDANDTEYTLTIAGEDYVCEQERAEPTLPATVGLRSPDGAIDVSLDGWFEREDEQLEFEPSYELRRGGAPADFVARWGDFGLELDGYDHVELELAVTLSAGDGQAEFRVTGYRDQCQAQCNATGCSGCPGLTPSVLIEVALQQQP